MKPFFAVVGILCVVPFVNAQDQPPDSKIEQAIAKYDSEILDATRDVLDAVETLKSNLQKKGNLVGIKELDSATEEFLNNGTLPPSLPTKTGRVYQRAVTTAKSKLEDEYQDEIKRLTKEGEIALAETLQEELTQFRKQGRTSPQNIHFARGDTFVGSRTSWDGKLKRYGVVIEQIKDSEISGYVVRDMDQGPLNVPMKGKIDARKITFVEKGQQGTALALVELTYTGEINGTELRLEFGGNGGRGESNRRGSALVTRQKAITKR